MKAVRVYIGLKKLVIRKNIMSTNVGKNSLYSVTFHLMQKDK